MHQSRAHWRVWHTPQGCLEMEKDLIDDDRRNVRAKPMPPSLHELNDLCRTLERALEEQVRHSPAVIAFVEA